MMKVNNSSTVSGNQIISAQEANRLQDMWMKLDSNGPRKEIDRVCKEYARVPTSYIAVADDGRAQVLIQGQPTTADNRTVAEAEQIAIAARIQTILRWNAKGYWFEVKP